MERLSRTGIAKMRRLKKAGWRSMCVMYTDDLDNFERRGWRLEGAGVKGGGILGVAIVGGEDLGRRLLGFGILDVVTRW